VRNQLIVSQCGFLCYHRGKGPLKNSSDVINAAKKIAEAGSRMDKLARAVADQVRMPFYSKMFCEIKAQGCV